MATDTITTPGTGTWVVPALITSLVIEAQGGGGGSGVHAQGEGGGGGGAYSRTGPTLAFVGSGGTIVPGKILNYTVGDGGAINADGGNTIFGGAAGGSISDAIGARGGGAGSGQTGGAGGEPGGNGDIGFIGGDGANGTATDGGGGGEGAGSTDDGGDASGKTGGSGTDGGDGGTGGGNAQAGTAGSIVGGGGAGGGAGANGAAGARGQLTLTSVIATVGPTAPTTNLQVTAQGATTCSLSWTRGNGAKVAVFAKATTSGAPAPVDDDTYAADTVFGDGDQIGASGWFCVYNGTGTSVDITALSASTAYRFAAVEYNGSAGSEKYMAEYTTVWASSWTDAAASAVQGQGHLQKTENGGAPFFGLYDGFSGGSPVASVADFGSGDDITKRAMPLFGRTYQQSGPLPPVGTDYSSVSLTVTNLDADGALEVRVGIGNYDFSSDAETVWDNITTGAVDAVALQPGPDTDALVFNSSGRTQFAALIDAAADDLMCCVYLRHEDVDSAINFDTSALALLTAVWTPDGFQTVDEDIVQMTTDSDAGPEGGGTIVLNNSNCQDTFINALLPTSGFGDLSTLTCGVGTGGADVRILIRFNLVTAFGIPLGSTITTFPLKIFSGARQVTTGSPTFKVYRCRQTDWLEGTSVSPQATWFNYISGSTWVSAGGAAGGSPENTPTPIGSVTWPAAGGNVTIDIATLAQDALDNRNGELSIILVADAGNNWNGTCISSEANGGNGGGVIVQGYDFTAPGGTTNVITDIDFVPTGPTAGIAYFDYIGFDGVLLCIKQVSSGSPVPVDGVNYGTGTGGIYTISPGANVVPTNWVNLWLTTGDQPPDFQGMSVTNLTPSVPYRMAVIGYTGTPLNPDWDPTFVENENILNFQTSPAGPVIVNPIAGGVSTQGVLNVRPRGPNWRKNK